MGDKDTNAASAQQHYNDNLSVATQPTSDNHLLKGNEYRKPDWSKRSNLDVIDFPMHHMFESIQSAFSS